MSYNRDIPTRARLKRRVLSASTCSGGESGAARFSSAPSLSRMDGRACERPLAAAAS